MLTSFRHFGLERDPFLDTADPRFYHENRRLENTRQRILASIRQSRGLVVVVGDPGTGKTSLSAALERDLLVDDDVVLGKLLDPSFVGEIEFLLGIARTFGLALPPRSPATLKNALKNFIFDKAVLERRTLVLVVDEAQNLADPLLEILRLLLNYDIPERKLLNVVMFGQSELRPRILRRTNLADRVDTWYELGALDPTDARALLAHRISRAGGSGLDVIFEPEALAAIVTAAEGTPRRLLTLSHAAFSEAASRSAPRVGLDAAVAAIRSRGLSVAEIPAASGNGRASDDASAEPPPRRRNWFGWVRGGA